MKLFLFFYVLARVASPAWSDVAQKPHVAVIEFEGQGISAIEAVAVTNFFRSALVNTNAFRVIDRSNVDKILAEQNFQQSGCTTTECAVQIGKLLNVEKMFIGSITQFQGTYFLNVKLTSIETAEVEISQDARTDDPMGLKNAAENLTFAFAARVLRGRDEMVIPSPEGAFTDKRRARVISVEGDKLLLDKGILHKLKLRDSYQVTSLDGKTKATAEVQEIGEARSTAKIQRGAKEKKLGIEIEKGDPLIYLWNKKILWLGGMVLIRPGSAEQLRKAGSGGIFYEGGGGLLGFDLRQQRIVELFPGRLTKIWYPPVSNLSHITVDYYPWGWFRRVFYFPPKDASVHVNLGIAAVHAQLYKLVESKYSAFAKETKFAAPFPGAGVELFIIDELRLRVDMHYYYSPKIEFEGIKYHTDSIIFLGGLYFCW